jgi:hypothetical protein
VEDGADVWIPPALLSLSLHFFELVILFKK